MTGARRRLLRAGGRSLTKDLRRRRRAGARHPWRRPRAASHGEFAAITGPSGVGQVDAAAHAGRPGAADERRDLAGRPAGRRAQPGPVGGAAPPAYRVRVPVLQPALQHDGGRQRRAGRAHGRRQPASRPGQRREELLGELGLAAKADAAPARLSGGEQQRVALARAMANRPQPAAGRRADRQPRQLGQPGGAASARPRARRRAGDPAGHPRRAGGERRRPGHQPVRRHGRRRCAVCSRAVPAHADCRTCSSCEADQCVRWLRWIRADLRASTARRVRDRRRSSPGW